MSNAKHTASKPLRPLPKASTGIAGLDEILGGGLPKGRPTLLCGPAGSGKTLLSMEFLVRGAALFAEPGVFMAFEETQAELVQNMASLGFDLSGLIAGGKLLVDFVHTAREEIKETGEYNLEGLFVRLGHAIDAIGAKRVVLDTVETLFYGLPNRYILRTELRRLFRWLKDRDVTAVITGEYRADGLTRHGLEEYVSDCVILLDHRVVEQISTRRLRVLKYRGSWHGTNEYPFIIDAQGFTVMPITSLGLHYPAYSGRISSGIPRLDALLEGGGFYRGSTLLVSGTAGTGKTSFAAHFAAAACQRDERALFFAFEEPPRQIMRNMHSIGVDLQPYVEKELLHFAAARPTACGLEAHLARAYRIIAKFQPKVVIADPINAFLAVNNEYAVKAMLIRLVDFLKRKSITAMFTSLTAGGSPPARTGTAISSFIDSWLLLTDLEKSGARKRSLYILKSRGMAHSHRIHEYLITDRGIELTDPTNLAGIYAGLEGVPGGPAPYVREAQAQYQPAGLPRRQETARRRRELACKRQALETQVAAMRKALSSKEAALRQVAAREQQQGARLPQNCAAATLSRHAAQNQTGGMGMTDSNIEQAAPNRQQIPEQEKTWRLRLYVAGQTPRSLAAFANLKNICEKHLPGGYTIEVVDLLENPQLAAGDQILAIPTLVRKLPPPLRKIVGSLANTERVLVGLDLKPRGPDRDNK